MTDDLAGTGGFPARSRGPVDAGPVATVPARRAHLSLALLATVLIAFVVAGFVGAAAGFFGARVALDSASVPAESGTIKVTGETREPVAAAAAAALPSVVNIDISGTDTSGGSAGLPRNRPGVPIQGNGSGVAFRRIPGGGTYIITNNHVVDGATSIVVTPVGGERLTGKVVGGDPETDIAVVRIQKTLPLIASADSTALAVGDLAVAIGSPFGLDHSVTSGVISAMHRSLPPSAADASGTASLVDVIQTDAAINPGNSGGALVDRGGRLIGINSAIFSSSGSNDGIGFAIPVRTAAEVADQLIATGSVKHAFLGIVGQSITAASAQQKKLPVSEGALVLEVVKGSGADKAGIVPSDVIVALDSALVRSMEDLIGAVREAGVGSTVTVKLYRGGKRMSVRMTVGVKPKTF